MKHEDGSEQGIPIMHAEGAVSPRKEHHTLGNLDIDLERMLGERVRSPEVLHFRVLLLLHLGGQRLLDRAQNAGNALLCRGGHRTQLGLEGRNLDTHHSIVDPAL